MEKDIYIKTEPGGKISFGMMSDVDIELFNKSVSDGALSKDILFKVKRGLSPYSLAIGVVNTGGDNDTGNEGLILLNQQRFEIPVINSKNLCKGLYIAYIALSKVSIEFKVKDRDSDSYDSSKLREHSTRINFPPCIQHQTYSDLNFNIVTDYSYNSKLIKNANRNMIDRGFDETIYIFSVDNNNVKVLYQCLSGDEVFF